MPPVDRRRGELSIWAKMKTEKTDILISGGGVAGLTAAVAFGAAGFGVMCVDPAAPVTRGDDSGADLRTTTFLQPSVDLLKSAGLWDRYLQHAAALQVMRIVDAGGAVPEPRLTKEFNATEISDAPFGWNIPNWVLRRELLERIGELDTVTFRPGVGVQRVLTREREARVGLSDGGTVVARLLIGADGRGSPVRQAVGIEATTIRYGQKALAFAVRHPRPHDNISTEVHRTGGPFTLIPLTDLDGSPCSAVVWMDKGPEIQRLAKLEPAAFEAEMNARSAGIFGHLTLASRLSVWPIISQYAERLSAERTALIAEAAHVVPPIGAQGLNMSLADTRELLRLATEAPDKIGERAMLEAYHRRRWPEVRARVAGIDMLNRASMAGAPALRDLRAGALNALYSIEPVRKTLMRAGLGLR